MTQDWSSFGSRIWLELKVIYFALFRLILLVLLCSVLIIGKGVHKITRNKYLWWGPKICFQRWDSEFPMKCLIRKPLIIFLKPNLCCSFYVISYRKNKSTTFGNGVFPESCTLIFCVGFYVEDLLTMTPPSNDCSPPNSVQGMPSLPHQACKLSEASLQCVLSKKNGVIWPKTQWEKCDSHF